MDDVKPGTYTLLVLFLILILTVGIKLDRASAYLENDCYKKVMKITKTNKDKAKLLCYEIKKEIQ